jgi:DNA-binding NarL/FixJ family response regulator
MLAGMAMRCLLVDDSARFLEAARILLEGEGVRVVGVAGTGAEALRQTAELRPDVLLVDIDLGDENGFELAGRLAGLAEVILVSTHAEKDVRELVETSAALGFLTKSALSAGAIRALLSGTRET